MKQEITVVIVDDNTQFTDLMAEYFNQQEDIKVIGVSKDGLDAIEKIKNLNPDIVILDIVMPKLDGIGVLERIANVDLIPKPQFIVLSAIGHDTFVQRAISLGAEYYIVKPFALEVLLKRVRQIHKEKNLNFFSASKYVSNSSIYKKETRNEKSLEIEVTNLMHEVGIPPHMKGYQYLRQAIILCVKDMTLLNSITKQLYPQIAEKVGTSAAKVERSIRNAIDKAWMRNNHDNIDALFGYTSNSNRAKPTNSEFIAKMTHKINLSDSYHR